MHSDGPPDCRQRTGGDARTQREIDCVSAHHEPLATCDEDGGLTWLDTAPAYEEREGCRFTRDDAARGAEMKGLGHDAYAESSRRAEIDARCSGEEKNAGRIEHEPNAKRHENEDDGRSRATRDAQRGAPVDAREHAREHGSGNRAADDAQSDTEPARPSRREPRSTWQTQGHEAYCPFHPCRSWLAVAIFR